MARNTPTIRDGMLVVERPIGEESVRIAVGSDAWFVWLDQARSFAFDDPSGHFTARKKQRGKNAYWYGLRRSRGKLHEPYLGKSADVTLDRLREVAAKLDPPTGAQSPPNATSQSPRSTRKRARASAATLPLAHSQAIEPHAVDLQLTPDYAFAGNDLELAAPLLEADAPVALESGPPAKALTGKALTGRELQVMRLIAKGDSNQQIAKELVIALTTVKRHVNRILRKLHVKNRTQAAIRAFTLHLITIESAPSLA
jgi:DNA-binding CsgD family transcriptional regulator